MTEKQENLFQSLSRMIDGGADPDEHHRELWKRFGETVAVLVMDTSGFSRTSHSHGIIHFLTQLMQLRRLCAPVFEAHRCHRLRFEADNAYATFRSVDDAVLAADEVHRALRESGLMLTADEAMTVSMGIGYGDLLYSETLEGYFGNEMNFASKLGEDLGGANETRLTESAYQQASADLRSGFRAECVEMSGVSIPHYLRITGVA